jgi:hypothetical protein
MHRTTRVSPVPGDLVKLLAPAGDYPVGTTGRVIAVPNADLCIVEFDDSRQLTVAILALKIAPWASLGG